jgi:hypothetical protein
MTTNKPKRTTPLGKLLMEKAREDLAKAQGELGSALVYEQRMAGNYNSAPPPDPRQRAVERGLIRRLATVLASEKVTPVIEVEEAERMKAWTDFTKIHITYRRHNDVRLMAAVLRGLMYHEGGHIRFTLPWPDLREMAEQAGESVYSEVARGLKKAWNALEDQRMETAVVSDSPRKAAYLTPLVMAELTDTLNKAAANYPLLVWRRYLPLRVRKGARKLFVMQHGDKGEHLAQRCEEIVDRYVRASDAVTMYRAVVDMAAVLQECRPLAYNLDDAGHDRQDRRGDTINRSDRLTIPVDESMINESLGQQAEEDEEEDDQDVDTTDPEVARHLAEVFSHLMIDPWNLIPVEEAAQQAAPQQGEQGSGEQGESEGDSESEGEAEGDRGDEGEGAPSGSEGDEGGDEGDEGKAKNDDQDDESDEGGTGAGDDPEQAPEEDLTEEDLQDEISKAEEERYNDKALDGDMDSYREALDNQASKLPVYNAGISQDGKAQAEADVLAMEIRDSFQAHINDRTPAWIEGQERGIINVIRYETRQPWEFNFYRDLVGEENPGFDMAVSVLLDYSDSMEHQMRPLAKAGYACKAACDALDIPCTVLLWNTKAAVLYDAEERAEQLPVIAESGGTDPAVALADLDNHRQDKTVHLVLIMTDGAWQGGWNDHKRRTLAAYKAPNRYFLGFGFGSQGVLQVERLKARGCDDAWPIRNLMEIPRWMNQAMLSML